MVRRQVQQHCHLRTKTLDVLELEARQLADHPCVRRHDAVECGQGTSDIPGHGNGLAGRAENRAEKLACGRLPVRAGDAEDGVRDESRPELDLTPDGRVTAPRSHHERSIAGHSRAFHHQVHAVEERGIFRTHDDFYAGLAKPPQSAGFGAIDGDNIHTVPCKGKRGCLT